MLISKFNSENILDNILVLEKKFNIQLPYQYRKFLIKYNGGLTPDTAFRLNKISSDIEGFYGFECEDKTFCFENISLKEFIVDKMFPIGINSFGDKILIDLGDGSVNFLYHDREKKYIKIAEDFASFVSKCKSKKIDHIRTIEERKKALITLGNAHKITSEKIAGWQAEIDLYANIHQEKVILEK